TSAIGIFELNVSVIMDRKKISRKKTSIILTFILFLVGLPAALSYTSLDLNVAGMKILDLMDESLGTMGLPIMALFIALVFTWFMDNKVLSKQVSDSKHWQFIVLTATKYVIPVILILVIISSLILRF
ncbi:MAG: sodium-dependent transporter, partial [Candidatus Thermoplasmatota archaeon]|nr:sodium-dependent transporter [Candidatus Thermoplasmatota archaeon]